jgi:hypothetical protein
MRVIYTPLKDLLTTLKSAIQSAKLLKELRLL